MKFRRSTEKFGTGHGKSLNRCLSCQPGIFLSQKSGQGLLMKFAREMRFQEKHPTNISGGIGAVGKRRIHYYPITQIVAAGKKNASVRRSNGVGRARRVNNWG